MDIRGVLLIMTTIACSFTGSPLHAQFVTLEGKDFKSAGADFYPRVMNYSLLLTRSNTVIGTPQPTDIYIAPDASFGPTSAFDCSDSVTCETRLLTDFTKIRDMGFNAVRVVGGFELPYRDTPEHGSDERRFTMEVYQNPFPGNNHDANHSWVDLEEGANGPYAARFFDLINQMLNVAQQADLKVILLGVGASDSLHIENRRHMYPTFDQKAVDEYAAYLAQMAEALQDHPALLAYDLFNEPQFNTLEYQEAVDQKDPNAQPKWRKQDICMFTGLWYDSIKLHDPNHLVTLGGSGDYELEVWDPAVLHIDFYSLHIYPLTDYLNNWNIQQSMQHYQDKLHWFGQTCPMPWIIGETGFSANDDEQPPHTGVGPQYHQYPYVDGTEADQADFVQWSLDLTRQCGGSGWSWWYFQEFLWWDHYYPLNHEDGPAYTHPDKMRGLYYALLKPGDANADYYDKLAVPVVQNYVPAPMPEPPGDEPANYYNWNNLPGPVSYTGTIVDQNNQPIQNAHAWLRLDNPDDIFLPPDLREGEEKLTFHVAVTNSSGDFQFHTQPQVVGFLAPVYYNLILVAVGASVEAHGGWFDGMEPPSGTTFHLDRTSFQLDGRVEGLTVSSTNNLPIRRFAGWTDLEVKDVTVTDAPDPGASQVEFVARHAIHIASEFHAQQGSEVHVFLDETFPDCIDDSFRRMIKGDDEGSMDGAASLNERGNKRIELSFDLSEVKMPLVRPNPFTNKVEVTWDSEDQALLQLLDATGRIVGSWQRMGPTTVLELGSIAAGPYHLRIALNTHLSIHTIIKQP